MKTTKAQDVYLALADDIAHGRLPPGAPLDEVQVAERFAVSRTPIREALRQLERSGLVEARPHRGALVRNVSERQLDDMFAVMAELEALCARWASFAMTAAERQSLRDEHARAAVLVKSGDRDGYIAANDRFHSALYAGSHSDYLAELARDARRRVAPFRRAQFDELGRLSKSHAEHGRVIAAIERGDAQAAYDAMRAHIVVVRAAVENLGQDGAEKRSRKAPKKKAE